MRLTERVHLVGGGVLGFGLSHTLDCHVYLVRAGDELVLIDAGAGITIEPILENIQRDGLDPAKISHVLLTHAHADHAGAAALWRKHCGAAVISSSQAAQYLSEGDTRKISLDAAKQAGFYPHDYVFPPCPVDRVLSHSECFSVGDLAFTAYETPGHCSGMLSFHLSEGTTSVLFSGDTVFHDGRILTTNVWDCDLQQYLQSIRFLATLNVDALLPGHMAISLGQGSHHIHKALECMRRLAIPANII